MNQLAPPTPVVGIGASAGGVEAFQAFFANTPDDTGMAFVVILHLPPHSASLLPDILRRSTRMPVVEAEDGCVLQPDTVYVPPPGQLVTLHHGRLEILPQETGKPRDPNRIDLFFDSLAQDLHADAVGVVLSGTGSDGALGLKAIKTCGGLTLAQGKDGSFPQQAGMPESAIATGAVDIVAPAEVLGRRIVAVYRARRRDPTPADLPVEQTDAARLAICTELKRQTGHDFSAYKVKTFLRRVHRRMQFRGIPSLEEYLATLQQDKTESSLLLRDLLISVTSFFRDPETFDVVEKIVLPRLFKGRSPDTAVRVWVPGCATGEEAYSLAIMFREFASRLGGAAPTVQIFATDIDDAAIATSRTGRYPSTLLDGLSPERLERFFLKGNDGSYTVAKAIREICTFSTHSLTRDPPFSRIDMVSCRNMLIYLNAELQQAIIPAFHYCLAPNGILLLGSSETVARGEHLFTALDRRHRIFQRRDVPTPPLRLSGPNGWAGHRPRGDGPIQASAARRKGPTHMNARATSRVIERFTPPHVVVTADGEIIQFSSRTGQFLEPAVGAPDQNVLSMIRLGLRAQLRAALKKSAATGHLVETPPLPVDLAVPGGARVSLAVEPLPDPGGETLYLVVFTPAPAAEIPGDADGAEHFSHESQAQLEADLRDAREQLQSVTEEHITALEELRSANEELHSVNEELQSTNEELETSREEIQSVNEELQTVNSQLAAKVDEMDHRNNDLKNLFDSTEVATVFLDSYLVVRGYTPAMAGIYNLIPSDIGRPLTDIVSQLRYHDLPADIRHVLNKLEPLERRVAREDGGAHYLMRILPYRTPASTVDGTLITFVEVTSIVQAEQHQRLLVDELNHRVKNMLTAVISLAEQTKRRSASLDDFTGKYLGRLHAMSAAYTLLSAEAWRPVPLHDVLNEEFKPFFAEDHTNTVMHGPRVTLEPRYQCPTAS
jgi:two-component system CheB/CheR fusion protein